MATEKLEINVSTIDSSVKKLKTALREYESTCRKLRSHITNLELDSTQMAAVMKSIDEYEAQLNAIRTYMNSCVINVLETAVSVYSKANIS